MLQISDNELLREYKLRFVVPTGTAVNGSDTAAHHAHNFIPARDVEHFGVIYLNGQNAVITTETLFTGTLTTSAVYPREVLKSVLKHSAAAVIFFHNHPSGNLRPSKDDLTLTYRLRDALRLIDVPVHDHIILTPDPAEYYSFADRGELS